MVNENSLVTTRLTVLDRLNCLGFILHHFFIFYVIITPVYKYSHSIIISVLIATMVSIGIALIINRYVENTTNKICKKQLLKLVSFKGN